ncbi:hypothetical protein BWI17_03815 [Betaproteobacteria bacterium GR16-43]|nr:hypothetical protein BWI17_03815 [Betaproteobacteria bacterium GR16-43]
MPNCDFYALADDFKIVLDFVFVESECRVFESASPFNQSVVEFRSFGEVAQRYDIGKCPGTANSASLELLAPDSGEILIERIGVGSDAWRYSARGWGLIQLHLGGESPKGILHSHTNHNTLKRATAWQAGHRHDLDRATEWNWPQVERTSRRINTFIRKCGVAKLGSRAVLPTAADAIERGANAI